jgi:outer membrane murein-binding lipoprotein Lpp
MPVMLERWNDDKMDVLDSKVDTLDDKVGELNVKVDALDVKVGELNVKVDALDVKVRKLEVKVVELDVKVDRVDRELGHLRQDFGEMRREVKEGFESMNRTLVQTTVALTTMFVIGGSALAGLIAAL